MLSYDCLGILLIIFSSLWICSSEKESKEVPFGKLLKANYPDLVFDIDVEDEKKEYIIEAF